MLPPIAEIPYEPGNTRDVIFETLIHSTTDFQAWGWVFHAATIAVAADLIWKPKAGTRAAAANLPDRRFMGVIHIPLLVIPLAALLINRTDSGDTITG